MMMAWKICGSGVNRKARGSTLIRISRKADLLPWWRFIAERTTEDGGGNGRGSWVMAKEPRNK